MKFNLKTIRRLNVLVAGGLSGLYFYRNAYHLEDIKSKLELKIENAPAIVSPKIKILVRNVMDDMGLSSEEKSLIHVFIANDFNLKHLGYPDKKFKVFLGVPQHFVLDMMTEFDVLPMVEDTHLSPDSPEAQNFKHVLSLSKEAKKFAVACEIYEAKHINFYYQGLLPSFLLLQGNVISFFSEKLFSVFGKSYPIFHGVIFLLALDFYILLTDLLNVYKQTEAEYSAAGLGASYIEGGIEYYEKMMERNKIIKKLNENAPYTETGELKKYMGFRTNTMPLKRRIQLLKEFQKNYKLSDQHLNPLDNDPKAPIKLD